LLSPKGIPTGKGPTAAVPLPFSKTLVKLSLSIAMAIACLTFKSCKAGVRKFSVAKNVLDVSLEASLNFLSLAKSARLL